MGILDRNVRGFFFCHTLEHPTLVDESAWQIIVLQPTVIRIIFFIFYLVE
jgi:hypothetical protein